MRAIYIVWMPHRKQLKRIEEPGHSRYLTFSCFGRLNLFESDECKGIFVEELAGARGKHAFRLFAWVIMPNHVHLLIRPDVERSPVSVILRDLKRAVARRVLKRWRRSSAGVLGDVTDRFGRSHFWLAGGGYDRNIYSQDELMEKTRYIHDNPVRRGLVEYAEDWAWSSVRAYAGTGKALIEIDFPEYV